MSHQEGEPTPERREGRARLSVNDPLVKSAVAAINFNGFNIAETIAFGNRMAADARLFQLGRCSSDGRRLSKSDAIRALGIALARMSEGGEP